MEVSGFAAWLNAVFSGFDYGILRALHELAARTEGSLTPIFESLSLVAEQGIGMFLLGIILLCFKKTRKAGFCIFAAVCCGALITNIVLKDLIARPRPFMDKGIPDYGQWWAFVGSPAESGFSFPSGHATATMAAMTAFFLSFNKRRSWPVFGVVLLMGLSRCYLMVHYPSDFLAGMLAGAAASLVSFYLTNAFYEKAAAIAYKFINTRKRSA